MMCELQSWRSSACKKYLQLLENISQRHLTAVSKKLLLHLIKDTTLDRYSLLFSHQRLQGGNLTIYISTFPKVSVQSTALAFTGLIWTQNPTILLKFIPVWTPSDFTRKQPMPLDRLPINCNSWYTGIFSDSTTNSTVQAIKLHYLFNTVNIQGRQEPSVILTGLWTQAWLHFRLRVKYEAK